MHRLSCLSASLALLGSLLFAASAGAAPNDTWTATASGTWGTGNVFTGGTITWSDDDGGSGDNTQGANDKYIVPLTFTATLDGTLTWDGLTTGTCLVVQGALSATISETGQAHKLVLPIGCAGIQISTRHTDGVGLHIDSGTCDLLGAYRETFTSTPTLQSSLGSNIWYVGDVVPCPDAGGVPDCDESGTGDASIFRFQYTAARWDDGSGAGAGYERFWDAALGDIATTDIVWMLDSDTTDQWVGAEVGNAYEINAVDSTFTGSIDIDVRQTNEAATVSQDGYPLTQRESDEGTLNAAIGAGGRNLVSAADLSTDEEWHASWLYVEDPDNATFPYPKPWRLSRSFDEVGAPTVNDTFDIYDPRGVPFDVASGEQIWVSRVGFEPGDEFAVLAPLRIESATAAATDQTDSNVVIDGACNVEGVIFDTLGYVELKKPPTSWVRNVIRDHAPNDSLGGQGLYILSTETAQFNIGATNVTGGSTIAANDSDYGIRIDAPNVFLHDGAIKHTADDLIVVDDPTTTNPLRVERMNLAYASTNEDSGQIFDITEDETTALFFDGISCADCAPTSLFSGNPAAGTRCSVNDVLYIGGTRGAFEQSTTDTCTYTNFGIYGGGESESVAGSSFPLVPANAHFFAVDDWFDNATNGNAFLIDPTAESISNGILRDVTLSGNETSAFQTNTGAIYRNLAFLDVRIDPAQGGNIDLIINNADGTDEYEMYNVSFVNRGSNDQSGSRRLFQTNATGSNGVTIQGLLIAGWGNGSAKTPFVWVSGIANVATSADYPFCFFDNLVPPSEGIATWTSGHVVSDVAPSFKDLPGGDISPRRTYIEGTKRCGILGGRNGPGIRRQTWAHSLNKLEPVFMGDLSGVSLSHGGVAR